MTRHSDAPTRPATLRDLGITPPPGWADFVEGARMDWLSAVAIAASREHDRIDRASLAATRAELTKRFPKQPEIWKVTT